MCIEEEGMYMEGGNVYGYNERQYTGQLKERKNAGAGRGRGGSEVK
jgi:hypothetical protein